jgi:hypothetical protein
MTRRISVARLISHRSNSHREHRLPRPPASVNAQPASLAKMRATDILVPFSKRWCLSEYFQKGTMRVGWKSRYNLFHPASTALSPRTVGARQLVGEALDGALGIRNLPASSVTGFLTWVWLDLAEQHSAQHTPALTHATANFPGTTGRGLRQQPRPDLQRSVPRRGKWGRVVSPAQFGQRPQPD